MLKCPYCHNTLKEKIPRCPICEQFIIDDLIESDYASVEKAPCLYCGKKILKGARICQFCHKWLDEVNQAINDLDLDNLYED